jgi:hypothetical protein
LRLDLPPSFAENAHTSRGAVEQQDVERIARRALKELGVTSSDSITVHAGAQPDVWQIAVGDRTLKIACGRGTTPQWVRQQIVEQYLAR